MCVSDYVVRDDVCMKGDDFASCGSDGVQQPHLRTAHFHCPTRGIFALHTYIHTFSKCTRKWIVQVLGIKDQEVLKRIMHSLSCGKFKVNWLYVLCMYVCSGEILIFLNARSWSACLPKAVVTRRRWGPKNMPHMNLCTVCMYVCMYNNDQIFKMQSFDITLKVSRIGRNSYDHSGAIFYV